MFWYPDCKAREDKFSHVLFDIETQKIIRRSRKTSSSKKSINNKFHNIFNLTLKYRTKLRDKDIGCSCESTNNESTWNSAQRYWKNPGFFQECRISSPRSNAEHFRRDFKQRNIDCKRRQWFPLTSYRAKKQSFAWGSAIVAISAFKQNKILIKKYVIVPRERLLSLCIIGLETFP